MSDGAETIAVIDDDAGFRQALAWMLKCWGYRPALAASPAELLADGAPGSLTCVLLDLRLADSDGIAEIARLRAAEIDAPIIIMTAYGAIPAAVAAVQQGAFAFLEKPLDHAALRDLLGRARTTLEHWRLLHGPATGTMRRFAALTPREREVFWGLVRALATKDIARELGITERTAEVHRGRVLSKMAAARVADLVRASFHVRRALGEV